jgi:phage portal protein BeeE
MPSLLSRIFGRAPEAKDSRAGALLALHSLSYARWTTRNAVTLTQAGYERNAVVFRAVRMIAEAAASIPWLVFEGRRENPDHPLADLIAQPNAGSHDLPLQVRQSRKPPRLSAYAR